MTGKNSYGLGMLAGILFPAVLLGVIYGLNYLVTLIFPNIPMLTLHKMMFASVALNILPIRFFLVKKEMEKTGKGILIITLVLIIIVTVLL